MPIIKCQECGKKKMSNQTKTKYCSARCRDRAASRRRRLKQKNENNTI